MFTLYPPESVSSINHIALILIRSTQLLLCMAWLCANKQGHWWSPSWLHTCRYHIQTHSRRAEERPLAFESRAFEKRKHHGSYSLSGDGLPSEFVRGGGNNCSDGDGPVGDGRPLWQPCDGRVLVFGPVEVMCPAELRLHRVPTVFHHSGTPRYAFICH